MINQMSESCTTESPFRDHSWVYEDDEYGSLSSGGPYEVYKCVNCGKFSYSPLPD